MNLFKPILLFFFIFLGCKKSDNFPEKNINISVPITMPMYNNVYNIFFMKISNTCQVLHKIFGIKNYFLDEDSELFLWSVTVSDCTRLTILNMLRYPAMIPAIPKMIRDQGAESSQSSNQVPIKKPTTTDSPTSNPIEL